MEHDPNSPRRSCENRSLSSPAARSDAIRSAQAPGTRMGIVAFYVDENVRRFGSSTSSGQADPAARASQPARAAQHPARTSAAARGILSEGLDLAFRQGGLRLADRGHQELAIAGGKPRRDARCAYSQRTAGSAARGGRDDETPDRLGTVRHSANCREPPDKHLREARDQRSAQHGRCPGRPPGRASLARRTPTPAGATPVPPGAYL